MKILTLRLTPGVSINLASDDDGWRFVSWATAAGPLSAPAAEALGRRFLDIDEALQWFRAICPAQPTGAEPPDSLRAPRLALSLQMRPRLGTDQGGD